MAPGRENWGVLMAPILADPVWRVGGGLPFLI